MDSEFQQQITQIQAMAFSSKYPGKGCFLCKKTRKLNACLCCVVILGDIKTKEHSALFWCNSELVMFENSYAMFFEIFPYKGSPVDGV